MNGQTYMYTYDQIDRREVIQTDKQKSGLMNKQTDIQSYRQTNRHV